MTKYSALFGCKTLILALVSVFGILIAINMYLLMNGHFNVSPEEYTLKEALIDSAYFTSTTISTVGYGDISPNTLFGKAVVAAEQFFVIMLTYQAIKTNSYFCGSV